MDNFKKSMRTRAQYAMFSGGVDWAARLALFRFVNNGWQATWGSFDHGFPRKIPGSILAAAISAPLGVPFEIARMAYYGDKSFPKDLQRGYKSYFNALWRIPFEEGLIIYIYIYKLKAPIICSRTHSLSMLGISCKHLHDSSPLIS